MQKILIVGAGPETSIVRALITSLRDRDLGMIVTPHLDSRAVLPHLDRLETPDVVVLAPHEMEPIFPPAPVEILKIEAPKLATIQSYPSLPLNRQERRKKERSQQKMKNEWQKRFGK